MSGKLPPGSHIRILDDLVSFANFSNNSGITHVGIRRIFLLGRKCTKKSRILVVKNNPAVEIADPIGILGQKQFAKLDLGQVGVFFWKFGGHELIN